MSVDVLHSTSAKHGFSSFLQHKVHRAQTRTHVFYSSSESFTWWTCTETLTAWSSVDTSPRGHPTWIDTERWTRTHFLLTCCSVIPGQQLYPRRKQFPCRLCSHSRYRQTQIVPDRIHRIQTALIVRGEYIRQLPNDSAWICFTTRVNLL